MAENRNLTNCMKKSMPMDDLCSMWNVYSRCKNGIENRNSWRLWHDGHFHHTQQEQDLVKVSPITTIVSSSTLIVSSISSHSTFGPQTPPTLIHQHHILSDHSTQQQSKQRTNKFYVDDPDEEEAEEEDGTFEQKESLWSTVYDDHYLEEAYQRNQMQPVLSAPPRKENPSVFHAAAPLAPSSATNQKQSLLSRLIQSSPSPPPSIHQQNAYDILPPQLQSCVDWEKSQNSIRYRLGYAPDLPNENIIW